MQKVDIIIYGDNANLLQEIMDFCTSKGYTLRANHAREWSGVVLDGDKETDHGRLVRTYEKITETVGDKETVVKRLVVK